MSPLTWVGKRDQSTDALTLNVVGSLNKYIKNIKGLPAYGKTVR
jgi:hypothetical protein